MKPRMAFNGSANGTDLELSFHPGKGTTDWNLVGIFINRSTTNTITVQVIMIDDLGIEYEVASETNFTGKNLTIPEVMRFDAKCALKIKTTGITGGTVNCRAVAELAVEEGSY